MVSRCFHLCLTNVKGLEKRITFSVRIGHLCWCNVEEREGEPSPPSLVYNGRPRKRTISGLVGAALKTSKENHLRQCRAKVTVMLKSIPKTDIRRTQRIGPEQRIFEFGFHNCAVHFAGGHLRHHLSVAIIVMIIIIIIHDANEQF